MSATANKVTGRCAAELEDALPEAVAACTALMLVCRESPADLLRLKAAAHRAAMAAGLVAGFAHMSR